MVNFSTRIPDCDFHSPILLDLTQVLVLIGSTAFPPLGNSDQVVVSVSIDFPINSKQDAPFHRIAYDYSREDWNGLRDHLRDVPWENIFKLSAFTAASEFCVLFYLIGIHSMQGCTATTRHGVTGASEFCECVQVGIDEYISHRK